MSAKRAQNRPLTTISLSSNRKLLPRSTTSRKQPAKQSPLSKSRQIFGDENAPPLDSNIRVVDLRNSPQKSASKPLNSLQEKSDAVPASPDPAVQAIVRIGPHSATVRKLSDSVLDSNSKQKHVFIGPRSVVIDSSPESPVLEDPVLSESPKICNLLRKRTNSVSNSSCVAFQDSNAKISADREKELENVCNDQATRIAQLTSLVEKLKQEKENFTFTVPTEMIELIDKDPGPEVRGDNGFDLREREELLNEIQTLRSKLEETDYALHRSVLGHARFVEHYVELQEKYNDLAQKQEQGLLRSRASTAIWHKTLSLKIQL